MNLEVTFRGDVENIAAVFNALNRTNTKGGNGIKLNTINPLAETKTTGKRHRRTKAEMAVTKGK